MAADWRTHKDAIKALSKENSRYPFRLKRLEVLPAKMPPTCFEVWRSRDYLLQVHRTETPGVIRLSVNRASVDKHTGRWTDGISWDDLQRLKRECGRGDLCGVELFPPDADVVNVANVRHVFVFEDGRVPEFMWKGGE